MQSYYLPALSEVEGSALKQFRVFRGSILKIAEGEILCVSASLRENIYNSEFNVHPKPVWNPNTYLPEGSFAHFAVKK